MWLSRTPDHVDTKAISMVLQEIDGRRWPAAFYDGSGVVSLLGQTAGISYLDRTATLDFRPAYIR